ncbi:diguanylate cyclase domain-containing protein [Erythrobacter alti]|uniref:diguanylate cyclase domain-containing protein n=1 Tax=Erythrobacter alti TaxID=1896145 RepID=UPI0030F48263
MFHKAVVASGTNDITSHRLSALPSFDAHRQYPVDWFSRKANLASSQVHQTVISSDGRLWAATPSGLASYDGVRIVTYGLDDGLKCHGLRALAVDIQGMLWVGSDVGLQRFAVGHGGFVPVSWDPCGVVEAIAIDKNVALVGTTKGLFTWNEPAGMVKVSEPRLAGATISDICITSTHGSIVVGPTIGIAIFLSGKWVFPESYDLGALGSLRLCMTAGDDLLMIAGDDNFGVFSFGGRLQASTMVPFKARSLCWDEGSIIVGDGNQVSAFTIKDKKLVGQKVLVDGVSANHLLQDQFGNIWMSTESHGIGRINGIRRAISYPAVPEIGSVLCIKRLNSCTAIGGTNGLTINSGLSIFKGASIWDVTQDAENVLWIASDQGLHCAIEGSLPLAHQHDCPALAAPCRSLLPYRGGMLVGSIRGLAIVDDDCAREILTEDGHPLGYVYSLFEDKDQEIWVTTLGAGLWKLTDAGLRQVTGGSLPAQCNITAVAQSPVGDIFVAHDNCISRISTDEPPTLFSRSRESVSAWALNFADNGHLLAGSTRGLLEFDVSSGQMLRRIADYSGDNNWEFTTSRSLIVDSGDKVLCGLASGLAEVSLLQLDNDNQAPSAKLSDARWTGVEPAYDDDAIIVEEGKWRVEFNIQTGWFVDEETTRMRYRLLGFEASWSRWAPIRPISYSSLPAGTYTLAVELQSPMKGTGPVKNVITFNVRGAWQSIARRLLSKLPAAIGKYDLFERAEKRMLGRKNLQLEQMIRSRTVELQQVNDKLTLARDRFDQLAHSDPLTGVANRRKFDQSLELALKRANNGDHFLSLILLDVDHFKSYNDYYGHAAGDECLKRVALALLAAVRKTDDLVARVGGEEFAILLPGTDEKAAEIAAERLRRCIKRLQLPHLGISDEAVLTVSLGAATVGSGDMASASANSLFSESDEQLYRAKAAGRNCWASRNRQFEKQC